jgi:multidrug efflux system outer membrane protein
LKKFFSVFIIISLLLTNGCIGPQTHPPRIQIPHAWPHQNSSKLNTRLFLPDMQWWRQFNSPELNQYIKNALCNNQDIHIAMANIDLSRGQLEEIKYSWFPGMSLLFGFTQFPILGNPGTFFIAVPSYIINIIQQYKQQKRARYTLRASYHAKNMIRLLIISQVADGFFTLISQQEALHIYHRLLKHYHSYLNLTQKNYQAGLSAQDDVALIMSKINQTQSQIAIIQDNIVASKNTLHFLLNQNPGNLKARSSFKQMKSDTIIPGDLPVTVLNNRPDVKFARSRLDAAIENVGATAAGLLPEVNLSAYLGRGTNVGNIGLKQAYLTQPIIDLPVFAQISESKAQLKAAYVEYTKVVRQALKDVDNDLSAYTTYTLQLRLNTQAFHHEKQHCHWSKIRYEQGITSQQEVIQCAIHIDEFELMLNQNKLAKMLVMTKLYQDLAGGYHVPN